MRTEKNGTTLLVTDLSALIAENCRVVKELTLAALGPEHQTIDINLGTTRSIDSEGLGTLISLHKAMCQREGRLRLINPLPFTEQMFKLLRLDSILEIVHLKNCA